MYTAFLQVTHLKTDFDEQVMTAVHVHSFTISIMKTFTVVRNTSFSSLYLVYRAMSGMLQIEPVTERHVSKIGTLLRLSESTSC